MLLYDYSDNAPALTDTIQHRLLEGDLIFIAVPAHLFKRVARATGGWVNHVGIALRNESGEWEVHESTVPWSRRSALQRYLARSGQGRVAIRRLSRPLTTEELQRLRQATLLRMRRPYHFGFNLEGQRQFCSKFVREAYREATGIEIGRAQSFAELKDANPEAGTTFWRLWFFGRIPLQRRTVTPESLYRDEQLVTVLETQGGSAGYG